MNYFVFKRTKVLDVCVELCLGLTTGIMSTVLAQAAYLVTWRLMRSVRTCEAIQKCKISLSVSVRVRLTHSVLPRLLVLLAPVPAQPWVLCPRWANRLSPQRSYLPQEGRWLSSGTRTASNRSSSGACT